MKLYSKKTFAYSGVKTVQTMGVSSFIRKGARTRNHVRICRTFSSRFLDNLLGFCF